MVDPIAFEIGGIAIRWYGLLISISILLGIFIAYRLAKYRGENPEEVLNFAPLGLLLGLVGTRLVHVLVNWGHFVRHPLEIIAIWRGGFAIHGAILGGVVALVIYAYVRKLNFWRWADILSPSLVLGQAIGRWGNFFNQEAFGYPTDLPWKIFIDPAHRPPGYEEFSYFHPTFLYESILNFVLFLVLLYLHRLSQRGKTLRDGTIFIIYGISYAVYRTAIEFLRVDSVFVGGIRVVHLLNFVGIAIFLALYFLMVARKRA